MRVRLLLIAALAGCGTTPNRTIDAEPTAAAGRGSASSAQTSSPAESEQAEPASTQAVPAVATSAPDQVPLIALVGGQPVTVTELLGAWVHRESPKVRSYLEELILSRVVMLEAGRVGVILPQSALDEALTDTTDRLRDEVLRSGSGLTVEEFIERRLGLDPKRYMGVLREQTAIDLFAARAVRAWMLMSERAEARVIVCDDEVQIRAAKAALDGGEDFAAVCARYSIDGAAKDGGRVPPVVRGPTAMARLAFSTPVGSVGGPVFEGERWLLMLVDGRPQPLTGTWAELGPLVEADLAAHPIEDPEYWQWKAWALERYEVDMTPFLELSGGALAD